jgi:hypothetical protein
VNFQDLRHAAGAKCPRHATRAYATEQNSIKMRSWVAADAAAARWRRRLHRPDPAGLCRISSRIGASTFNNLKPKFEKQMDVPPDRQFTDGWIKKKAIDSLDRDMVSLPHRRPSGRFIWNMP